MILGAKLLVGNSILKLICFAIVLILKEKAVKKIVKSTGKAGVQILIADGHCFGTVVGGLHCKVFDGTM